MIDCGESGLTGFAGEVARERKDVGMAEIDVLVEGSCFEFEERDVLRVCGLEEVGFEGLFVLDEFVARRERLDLFVIFHKRNVAFVHFSFKLFQLIFKYYK